MMITWNEKSVDLDVDFFTSTEIDVPSMIARYDVCYNHRFITASQWLEI